MPEINQILLTLPFSSNQKELIAAAAPTVPIICKNADALKPEDLAGADVILGNIPVSMLPCAKALKWLQLGGAGAEGYRDQGALPANAVLTCASGAYGPSVAEHALAMLFSLQKRLPQYAWQQAQKIWADAGNVHGLYVGTVLIAGFGDIGQEFARLIRPFSQQIVSISTHPCSSPLSDEHYTSLDDMDTLLPQADVLFLCLPGTNATHHVLSADRLNMMKASAVVLNVGRGSAIDTEALCYALEQNRLWGAGLDVVEPEPLPSAHRLWRLPNTLITPHVAGGFHLSKTLDTIAVICADNLQRYQSNLPLRSRIDIAIGYAQHEDEASV